MAPDAAAGHHINHWLDSPPGRQTLAVAASLDLLQRRGRSNPFHLAGESRFAQAADVRRCSGCSAVIPNRYLDCNQAQGTADEPGTTDSRVKPHQILLKSKRRTLR